MEMIKVMVFEPGKIPYIEAVRNEKRVFDKVVGGNYEKLNPDRMTALIYNPNGKQEGLKANRAVGDGIVYGTFFLAADLGKTGFGTLSPMQRQFYNAVYGEPGAFDDEEFEEDKPIRIRKDEMLLNNVSMQINGFDLQKVSASYHTEEKTEAKELLKLFHNEFCKAFDTECVDDLIDSGEDFIHLPAVIKSRETGDICIGFVEVDIDSSGEHWGTNFLFDRGFVSHNDTLDRNPMVPQRQAFGVYDYWYTPDYYGDIHSDKSTAPKDVREMLEYAREQRQSINIYEFKEHSLTLRGEKKDMLDFVNAVRESNTDGTLSDLAYTIEYAFDIDSIRSTNEEDECSNDEDYAENNYGITGMDSM